MQKSVGNMLVGLATLLLAGCFSTNSGTSMFSPYPFQQSNSGMTLAQSVQDALASHDLAQVHVETNQNVVILSGYVQKIRQSDTAEQIAREFPGVQRVENRIIVRNLHNR